MLHTDRINFVLWCVLAMLLPRAVHGLPVFAHIYDKPCGACHTVFPQLNPQGEYFRARGLHGLRPAIDPLKVGSLLEVPGTVPLALYVTAGEHVTKVDEPAQRNPTTTHFTLDFLSLLAGGELGPHLAFLLDYELVETEPDTGDITINSLPEQAYMVAHGERWGWFFNAKGGWYELPLGASPVIHRLSVHPYLAYGLNACTLLDQSPPGRDCQDVASLGETQIGLELNGLQPNTGLGWAAGVTNGSNNRLSDAASKDLYLRVTQNVGLHRAGIFLSYSPDIIGGAVDDHALRLGPDLSLYWRRVRLFTQFLAGYDSNPTARSEALWFYGGFVEVDYRLTPAVVSLLRVDYAWTPRFDDIAEGGSTRVRRQLWELTGGGQWLLLENVKLVAELTYGENHESVSQRTVGNWSGTVRFTTAFWPFTPPGLKEWLGKRSRQ